ncbi:MAG: 4Fe-4S binding protein [Clostridium sp.]|nr:4Fe-4S binding protein [Clostridium sp.]
MKQLLIISGKGGTGKTTIASSLIKLSKAKAFADCDVDAPNLHLIMREDAKVKKTDFYGLDMAKVYQDKCISCNLCKESCRFDAISSEGGYSIDPFACEGCGVCQFVCPVDAIEMVPRVIGNLRLSKAEHVFSTAELIMGSGNSGLLVTEVKKQLIENAQDASLAIIDGSPGIGCPVIASISGVDMVLIVTEPTISGYSDMKRIIETSKGFPVKIGVCINKYDLHKDNTEKIESFCKKENLLFLGKIPYDESAVSLINNGLTLVDNEGPSKEAINNIYNKLLNQLI